MNSVINPYYVSEFFRNIFDVPDYYIFHGTCSINDADATLGSIGVVNILLNDSLEFKSNEMINSIIRITDFNEYYDLLFSIDDFVMLIINDTIKTLGGVIYEKDALLGS